MKRGIQCPERGGDQLALLPLYVALVQRVEADGDTAAALRALGLRKGNRILV